MLRIWIMALVICASQRIKKTNNSPRGFLVVNLLLLLALLLTFSATDYLLFYIRFERSLIPTFILILGWGYQPERIQAGVYMLFYTLFASLPLLVSLLRFYRLGGSLTIGLVPCAERSNFITFMWYFCTIFAFVAHVEAPVAGSIILAGVLLKLVGYVSVRILGGVIVRFICLRQVDIKSLIAYSSVAHIGLVLRGLVVFGAVVIMVGHGLCSSGLFCLANIVYERLGSRRLLVNKEVIIEGDKRFNRFIYLVLAFVLSIGALIVRPNIIRILLGWDGLGLVSYALVIFYQNEKSANAGILTVLSNRCLVVIAAVTKRAQIPFSAWLPAAMAAPTPVSALVHSSTLVTAGVYLLIRFSPALIGSEAQSVLLIISCLTIFIAGLGANFEYDLKKIIALSTLSQLGVILRILALGFADLAFFHLLAHALFKALLFICAGVVIHAVKEYQDIRCIGRLVFRIPLTRTCINLANLALCGIPFLAGFYSKDLILEVAFIRNINLLAFILYALATGLTVCYRFRLVYYSLTGLFNLRRMSQVNDKSVVITRSMIRLRIGGVTGGAFLSWVIFPESYIICLTFTFKVLALALRVLGALIGYLLNIISVNYRLRRLKSYSKVVFIGSMCFIPFLSTFNLSHVRLKTAGACMNVGDYG
ncbi:NADH-ubiquinone oxidoreductase chain 5-like 4, partial [Homarus americanus]